MDQRPWRPPADSIAPLTPGFSRAAGLATLLVSVLILLALDDRSRSLAAPLLAIANVAVCFVLVLWQRDGAPPVFDVGTACFAFTLLYGAYPVFAFLMADGTWTLLSDNRLLQWSPDSQTIGWFVWRYVVYTGALAGTYLAVRGRGGPMFLRPVREVGADSTAAILWLLAALTIYFGVIWFTFGVTYSPAYRDVQEGSVRIPTDLPYVLQQISHNFKGIIVILKIALIAILLQSWRSWLSRVTLAVWLAFEMMGTFLRMGARTETLMLILATGFLYHRIVRPLRPRAIVLSGAVLVTLALAYGFARDLANARYQAIHASYWSAANEFQILMGTAYDIHMRQATGALEAAPWQLYWADLLRLVPSQLLSVAKVEPADWYISQLGLQNPQAGLMFGVISQAILGLDWIELFIRGAAVGVLLGGVHRLYFRRADSFWWSVFYVCMCLWSYYTFRASTFYLFYFVIYHFVPALVFVTVASWIIRSAVRKGASDLPLIGPSRQAAT